MKKGVSRTGLQREIKGKKKDSELKPRNQTKPCNATIGMVLNCLALFGGGNAWSWSALPNPGPG